MALILTPPHLAVWGGAADMGRQEPGYSTTRALLL
jgi:hypothetical protein